MSEEKSGDVCRCGAVGDHECRGSGGIIRPALPAPGDVTLCGSHVVMLFPNDPSVEVRTLVRTGETPRDAAKRLLNALTDHFLAALDRTLKTHRR